MTVQPNLYIQNYSSGGEFTSENLNVSFLGWKINSKYSSNNFEVLSSFSAHGIQNYKFNLDDLINIKSIPYSASYMDNYDNLWIYWLSEVAVKYSTRNKTFSFRNFGKNIGESRNSIFISNKPINYPTIDFKWEINPKLDFHYQYSFLNKKSIEIEDTPFYKYKSLVYHGLKYQLNSKIQFILHETVIFDRNLDFNYLNPFIFYYPISRYIGYNDNNQIGIECLFAPNKRSKYFASLLIDEWDPDLTFEKYHENWIAYQVGGYLNNIFLNDKFYFEYTWTDFRVYENLYEDADFYLNGSSIGFWTGSHAQSFIIDYNYSFNKFLFNLSYLNVKRGFQPENLIDVAYEKINFDRFSKGYEQKEKFSIELDYFYNSLLEVGISVNYLNWTIDSKSDNQINGRLYFGTEINYFFKELNL